MHLKNTTLYQIFSQNGVNARQYIVYYYHNIFNIGIIILRFLLNVQSYKINVFYQA